MESWYEVPGTGQHLHEAHIQWNWLGVTRRPLTVSVNAEQAAGAVGVFGVFGVHNDAGVPLFQVSNGTVWTHGAVVRAQPDAPVVMGMGATRFVEVVRIVDDRLEFGRNADKATVTTCDELITAMAELGLVRDGR